VDYKLSCTACGRPSGDEAANSSPRCPQCGEPLELALVEKGRIREGNTQRETILERYRDFFPFDHPQAQLSLGEGFTPLLRSRRLEEGLDLGGVYLKNETQNPTWSFKDRGTVAGMQHAHELGYRRVGTLSSGNMAASVAAYGARAGLETFILVAEGIPSEKLNPVAIYGSHLIKVDGDYGDLYFASLEAGRENGIYFINSDVPFRIEGSKTIAFEICEQLDFDVPNWVIVPTSAGGNFRGILKGFEEFRRCGLIDEVPKMVCAQAAGCSPIYNAFSSGRDEIERIPQPKTMAHAIANPFPPSGNEVLRRLRHNGGLAAAVSEEEIIAAQQGMAEEGIFGQPASAVPLAVLRRLRDEGVIAAGDRVALVVTGGGLKYLAAFEKHRLVTHQCHISELGSFISGL